MNALFLTAMVIEGVFALGFLAVPARMLGPFGVTLDVSAAVFARLLGSALLGYVVLLGYGRRSDKAEFRTAVCRGLFIYYFASTLILGWAQGAGLMNPLGWIIVALHLAFLAWFGLYAFRRS
jgi:hypothetical protein